MRHGIQLSCRKRSCPSATASSSRTRNSRTVRQFTIHRAKWCPSTATTYPSLGPVPCLSTVRFQQHRTYRRPVGRGAAPPEPDRLTAAITGPILWVPRTRILLRRIVPMTRMPLLTQASNGTVLMLFYYLLFVLSNPVVPKLSFHGALAEFQDVSCQMLLLYYFHYFYRYLILFVIIIIKY